MMYGTQEIFQYFECNSCGCLQIINIPKNMEKYYSNDNYYSFEQTNNKFDFIKRPFRIKRNKYLLFKNNLLGKIVNKIFPLPNGSIFNILKNINLKKDSKILDVGCGSGMFLNALKELNFNNLMGVDPYIEAEIDDENLQISKLSILEIPNELKFNLIIFSHSFEHLQKPLEIMFKISELLIKDGLCIIRMPIKNKYIWNLYGTNWVQIDAPRHFFLYTIKSLDKLTTQTNLKIEKVIFDSDEFQFWGSEQNKMGIPLISERSYIINPKIGIFTKNQIKKYKKKSVDLNIKNMGDQATILLKHK